MLNNIKKSVLKGVASFIMQNNVQYDIPQMEQCCFYIMDIIDSKFYKPHTKKHRKGPKFKCLIEFHNKAVETIRLNSIFRLPEVIHLLPSEMRKEDDIPMVTYNLSATVRSKIFNYKKTVEELHINEETTSQAYSNLCQCSNSAFCGPNHGHIITGDLRLIENSKLRKLLTEDPKFRELYMTS